MEHRKLLIGLAIAGVAVLAWLGWIGFPLRPLVAPEVPNWDRRVYFVCCNDHGEYSSGVYMRVGGGSSAFDTVREASPFMRRGDPCSAAAGLCGFLFKKYDYQGETVGTLVLNAPPRPDEIADWNKYGGDGDVILINVDKATAKCVAGSLVGEEIRDLPLGGGPIGGGRQR
jgi:hypothetical protein